MTGSIDWPLLIGMALYSIACYGVGYWVGARSVMSDLQAARRQARLAQAIRDLA